MRKHALRFAIVILALLCRPATAQTPAAPKGNQGWAPTTLMDRPEVRVVRVEIQPGVTRPMHAHNDMRFHHFVPLSPGMQLLVGSDAPVDAPQGQPHFIKGGTTHGFKNTGTSVATVMEIFVRDSPAQAAQASLDLLALAHALVQGK